VKADCTSLKTDIGSHQMIALATARLTATYHLVQILG